jgi:hypothetical protein
MTNHSLLNETIKNLYESTPDYVHSVGYGYKFISGKCTDQLSIKFNVDKKLPPSDIPDGEILPKNITVDGVEIVTDVLESKRKKPLGSCYGYTSEKYGDLGLVNYKIRPLVGGTSIANFAGGLVIWDEEGYPTDTLTPTRWFGIGCGTLGAIVVDNSDNSLVGLTNAHVVIGRDGWEHCLTENYTEEITTPYGTYGDIYDKRTYNHNDDILIKTVYGEDRNYAQNIYQPGEDHYTDAQPIGFAVSENDIGKVKRYVPFDSSYTNWNFTDGALISLKKSELDETKSKTLHDFPYDIVISQNGFPFATTREIDSILTGDQRLNSLFSVGRTTGPKGSLLPPSWQCSNLKLTNIHVYDGGINYSSNPDEPFPVPFGDLLEYAYSDYSPYPSDGGDSGSVLVAPFGNPNSPIYKIIGLLFAGYSEDYVSYDNTSYACRIDRVAKDLNISAFTGSGYADSSLMTVTRFISGSQSDKISGVFCKSGVTGSFWQAGLAYNSDSVYVNNVIMNNTDSENCKQY